MIANEIKAIIMHHARFNMNHQLVVPECCTTFYTETGNYVNFPVADVLTIRHTSSGRFFLYDWEVKINLNDFKADFKKFKHQVYQNPQDYKGWQYPHYFVFVLDRSIWLEDIIDIMPKNYGICYPKIRSSPRGYDFCLEWVKKPKRIHSTETPRIVISALEKASREIVNTYEEKYINTEWVKGQVEKL